MRKRIRSQALYRSRLGDARIERGVSQAELAAAVGVSIKTIERLEQGKLRDPGIRLLNNCALALGLKLESVIETRWRQWQDFDGEHPEPPDPEVFIRRHRLLTPKWVERLHLGE